MDKNTYKKTLISNYDEKIIVCVKKTTDVDIKFRDGEIIKTSLDKFKKQ